MQRVAEGVIYLHAGAGVPGGCAAWYRSWAVQRILSGGSSRDSSCRRAALAALPLPHA